MPEPVDRTAPTDEEIIEMDEAVAKVQDEELHDMLDFFEGPINTEEKKEVKEEVAEFKPKEEEIKKEEVKEEKVEIPKEEPKKEEVKVDERDSRIAELRAEINRLAALNARDGKDQIFPPKKEEIKEEVKEEKKEVKPVNELLEGIYKKKEFLTKEQLDEFVDHPEYVNDAIHKSNVELAETFMDALPLMINLAVNRELILHKTAIAFYEKYPDLADHRDYVSMTCNEVEKESMGKNIKLDEIFNETATRVRKKLGLKEPVKNETKKEIPPAFGGSKTGTTTPIAKGGKQEIFDKNAEDLMDFQG